ncbi:MAG: hypothetical protein WD030_10615 [Pirellulales bacterium]
MDKKAKKRLEVVRKKIQTVQQQLAGAKQQMDDPDDVTRLERELAELHAEMEKLKAS